MTAVFRLAYTAAKRYEKCPLLQLSHKLKTSDQPTNSKPFFVGRVVHRAAETFMYRRGYGCSLVDFIPHAWELEEAAVDPATLIWVGEERQAEYTRALDVGARLDAMLRDTNVLEQDQLWLEPKFFTWLAFKGSGMFANPDILAVVGDVGFVGEIKSGKTYDPDQPAWYAAVIERMPEFEHVRTWVALPILPAVKDKATPVEVDTSKREAQRYRAEQITAAMHRGEWEARPGSYCAICEARSTCPSYAATFGHLTKGRVGLGPTS